MAADNQVLWCESRSGCSLVLDSLSVVPLVQQESPEAGSFPDLRPLIQLLQLLHISFESPHLLPARYSAGEDERNCDAAAPAPALSTCDTRQSRRCCLQGCSCINTHSQSTLTLRTEINMQVIIALLPVDHLWFSAPIDLAWSQYFSTACYLFICIFSGSGSCRGLERFLPEAERFFFLS